MTGYPVPCLPPLHLDGPSEVGISPEVDDGDGEHTEEHEEGCEVVDVHGDDGGVVVLSEVDGENCRSVQPRAHQTHLWEEEEVLALVPE